MLANSKHRVLIFQLAIAALICLCPCLAYAQDSQGASLEAGQATPTATSAASGSHALAAQASDVDSFLYKPAKELKLVEGRDVRYADTARGRLIDVDCDFPCDGDTLIVFHKDGTSTSFEFNAVIGKFESTKDKTTIPQESFFITFMNTDGTTWSEGNIKQARAYYMPNGKFDNAIWCALPVTLEPNPVKSISYKPKKGYSPLYFNNRYAVGIPEGDVRFWYPSFVNGDVVTITYAKGGAVNYTYVLDENVFRAKGKPDIDANIFTWYDAIEADDTGVVAKPAGKSSLMYYNRKFAVPVKILDPSKAGNDVLLESVKDIYEADITLSADSLAYTGVARKPAPKVEFDEKPLTKGVDYTVSYRNNVKASDQAEVIIRGIGEYSGETIFNFEIRPVNIKKIRVLLNKRSFTYNGKVQHPNVKTPVTMKVGGKIRTLRKGVDYTVKYSNAKSTKAGTYYVWLVGKGNYAGCSSKVSYTIKKKR